MKKFILQAFVLCGIVICFISCEKLDMEKYLKENGFQNNEDPENITEDGEVQRVGAVDLGLSVKWAAQNLMENGFTKDCTDIGTTHQWSTEYISNPPEQIGGTAFDPSTEKLGSKWQTPSEEQWEELKHKCRIHYTIFDNAVGYVITGKTGKAIFIPTNQTNEYTIYWSSSSAFSSAVHFSFQDENIIWGNTSISHKNSFYIRPVEKK